MLLKIAVAMFVGAELNDISVSELQLTRLTLALLPIQLVLKLDVSFTILIYSVYRSSHKKL